MNYPDSIESHNPDLHTAIRTFQKLSDRLSPQQVRWRYDPIIISSVTPVSYHLQRFEQIARALQGCTRHCIFSFLQFYGKTGRNLGQVAQKTGIRFFNPSLEKQHEILSSLADIARSYGIILYSCCNEELLIDGVQKNRCIDPEMIRERVPDLDPLPPFRPTRKDCGCIASVDIGVYDTCLLGCTYCYATNQRQAALSRHSAHDPSDSILWRPAHLFGKDLDAVAVELKEQH